MTSFFDREQVDKCRLELWSHTDVLPYQAAANTDQWETILHSCYWGWSNEQKGLCLSHGTSQVFHRDLLWGGAKDTIEVIVPFLLTPREGKLIKAIWTYAVYNQEDMPWQKSQKWIPLCVCSVWLTYEWGNKVLTSTFTWGNLSTTPGVVRFHLQ